jgi:hypothetical protein
MELDTSKTELKIKIGHQLFIYNFMDFIYT